MTDFGKLPTTNNRAELKARLYAFMWRTIGTTITAVFVVSVIHVTLTVLGSLRRTPECVAFDRYRHSMNAPQHATALQACTDSMVEAAP